MSKHIYIALASIGGIALLAYFFSPKDTVSIQVKHLVKQDIKIFYYPMESGIVEDYKKMKGYNKFDYIMYENGNIIYPKKFPYGPQSFEVNYKNKKAVFYHMKQNANEVYDYRFVLYVKRGNLYCDFIVAGSFSVKNTKQLL